jgi:hypothetical protein
MKYTASILIFILLGLSACSPAPTQAPSRVPPTATLQTNSSGYPEPSVVANPQAAYPMPTVDYSNTGPLPTDDPADGKVRAVIFNNGAPVAYTVFFLADVMKDPKTGLELGTSLDRNNAPKAVSAKDGQIEFVNVPPGRYGLILLDGTSTYLLVNPDDGKAILLTVTAGSLIDLKQLKFINLPIN